MALLWQRYPPMCFRVRPFLWSFSDFRSTTLILKISVSWIRGCLPFWNWTKFNRRYMGLKFITKWGLHTWMVSARGVMTSFRAEIVPLQTYDVDRIWEQTYGKTSDQVFRLIVTVGDIIGRIRCTLIGQLYLCFIECMLNSWSELKVRLREYQMIGYCFVIRQRRSRDKSQARFTKHLTRQHGSCSSWFSADTETAKSEDREIGFCSVFWQRRSRDLLLHFISPVIC